jgi:hypothetical protein
MNFAFIGSYGISTDEYSGRNEWVRLGKCHFGRSVCSIEPDQT